MLLTLWMAFEPRQDQFGGGLMQSGPYDIVGNVDWADGVVEQWKRWVGEFSDPVVLGENNSFLGIDHFQYPRWFGYGEFVSKNPVDLFYIRWTPNKYTPRTVTLDNGGPGAHIYTDVDGNYLRYSGVGGHITFHVVPAPAAAALLLPAGVITAARRRR